MTRLPDDVAGVLDHIERMQRKVDLLKLRIRESKDAVNPIIARRRWSEDQAMALLIRLRELRMSHHDRMKLTSWDAWSLEHPGAGPPTGVQCVYLLMVGAEVAYVGVTGQFRNRIKQHRKDQSKPFDTFQVFRCESRRDALDLEAVLQQQHRPIWNKKIERRPA